MRAQHRRFTDRPGTRCWALALWLLSLPIQALAAPDPPRLALASGEPAGPRIGEHLPAVQSTEVREQPEPTINPPAHTEPGYRAVPVVVILWGAKALAATALDEFLDYGLAALLGVPGPTTLDHLINVGANLTPYLGELRHLEKAARIVKAAERVVEGLRPLRALAKGHSRGAVTLVTRIERETKRLGQAVEKVDLAEAKQGLGQFIGYAREGQLARRLTDGGREMLELGLERLRNGKELGTEIDLVFREGGEVIFAQVKAMSAAAIGPGSKRWGDLTDQLGATIQAADKYAKLEGVTVRLRYYVDNISDEARRLLESQGVEVVLNATVLH